MTKKFKILIVEDSLPEGTMLFDILEDEGYEAVHVIDAERGLQLFKEQNFDLLLLDIMLPGKDGFQMAKQVKAINESIPIIFLTSKTLKSDEIQGFAVGADDYLSKPYDRELLIWRVKALLKRQNSVKKNVSESYEIGSYTFEYKNQTITRGGDIRQMTKREADILQMLCVKHNELITRDDILLFVWGNNDYFNGRSLDVFIAKLRKYLSEDPDISIETAHGVGFRLHCKTKIN